MVVIESTIIWCVNCEKDNRYITVTSIDKIQTVVGRIHVNALHCDAITEPSVNQLKD
jgi:hypothetical protein